MKLPALLARPAWNIYKSLETDQHPLLYLFLEVTRRCNLTCLHCGSDCRSEAQSEELILKDWIKILDQIRRDFAKPPFIVLTGGEILTFPHLNELTTALKNLGFAWGIVTNGLLLSADTLTMLTQNQITGLTISLDGPAKAHDKLRGRTGAFDKAISALKRASAAGIPLLDAVTCVYPDNLNSLHETAEILISCGVKDWRLFRIFPSGRVKEHPELTLNFEQTHTLLNWIAANRKTYQDKGLNLNYSCEGHLDFKLDRTVRTMPYFCRAGIEIASILADGNITGCSNNAPAFYQGNIKEITLFQAWNTSFEVFRKKDWAKKGPCAKCNEFGTCQGNSIHLWHDTENGPAFCFHHEI